VRTLDEANHALDTLREVMRKGQGMYERSKGKASPASYRRAKEMTRDPGRWGSWARGRRAACTPCCA